MRPFKFFRDTKYILSATREHVPATTPIGILRGYVDANLSYDQCVPYRVIVNGITHESEVVQMTYNEYVTLINDSDHDVRLCGIVLVGRGVYEVWNGIEGQFVEYPSEFIGRPNMTYFIEIIKLPRYYDTI